MRQQGPQRELEARTGVRPHHPGPGLGGQALGAGEAGAGENRAGALRGLGARRRVAEGQGRVAVEASGQGRANTARREAR
ncbi:hypothetical protein [Streptomyces sp. NBC_00623]|uniref:hypothetical protein n=1 Tax=Streptomyces sp. NBC_00623 TaxID=2975790 RepID=UPI0030E04FA4